MNWTDGRHLYMRGPAAADNQPLHFYTNRWSTAPWWQMSMPDDRTEFGRFMPGVDMPVGRMPITVEEMGRLNNIDLEDLGKGSLLFDIEQDPDETKDLVGSPVEEEVAGKLKAQMEAQNAPGEQFDRLGLG